MLPNPDQVKHLLSLSDERDLWHTLADQAFRDGYFAGQQAGFDAGYAQCETDEAKAWRAITHPLAHPEAYAAQRLRLALAFSKSEADEHERSFVARAYATPRRLRTPVQQATIHGYPPPARAP